MESFNLNNTFFYIDQTKMIFPRLENKKESIPVGDSVTLCVSISWATKDRKYIFKLYILI